MGRLWQGWRKVPPSTLAEAGTGRGRRDPGVVPARERWSAPEPVRGPVCRTFDRGADSTGATDQRPAGAQAGGPAGRESERLGGGAVRRFQGQLHRILHRSGLHVAKSSGKTRIVLLPVGVSEQPCPPKVRRPRLFRAPVRRLVSSLAWEARTRHTAPSGEPTA
jgi:hypothetical protein